MRRDHEIGIGLLERRSAEEPPSRRDRIEVACSTPACADFTRFEGDPDFILSLARGLCIIEAFEGGKGGRTVADVARRTGLSRAAVRRSFMTLQALGYAESRGPAYLLTTRALRLGFSYLSSASLPALAQPVLERITETAHESSSLCVLEGDEIVYIARAAARRLMSVGLSVGSRLPAYCTSMGRVLLAASSDEQLAAYFERISAKALTPKTVTDKRALRDIVLKTRSNGFAMTEEELEPGLRSIAVPVQARNGRVVASMNIGVHALRVSAAEMIQRLLPILQKNAQALGEMLA
jgi:IclR family pca regulon transcriptional regulator